MSTARRAVGGEREGQGRGQVRPADIAARCTVLLRAWVLGAAESDAGGRGVGGEAGAQTLEDGIGVVIAAGCGTRLLTEKQKSCCDRGQQRQEQPALAARESTHAYVIGSWSPPPEPPYHWA